METQVSKFPEAIQRQIDEAEALEKQLYGQPEGDVTEGSAEVVDQPVVEPVQTEQPAPEPQEPQQQPELKAKPGREEDVDYWRSRANALHGLNQQQAQEVQALKQHLQNLASEVEHLKTAKTKEAEAAEKDNDAEVFGEDLIEAVDRRAKRMAEALVAQQTAQMQAYIKQLEGRLSNVDQQVATSAQDRFVNRLAQLVPDYEAVNVDNGFLSWLGEADPVYGVTRQAALDAAAQNLDADRVANVFNAYKVLTGKQGQTQQRQQVRQELERQVAPAKATASAPTAPAGKIWTRAEFERAYDPRNIRDMGQAKADALVAQAEQALAEGRVQW